MSLINKALNESISRLSKLGLGSSTPLQPALLLADLFGFTYLREIKNLSSWAEIPTLKRFKHPDHIILGKDNQYLLILNFKDINCEIPAQILGFLFWGILQTLTSRANINNRSISASA
ncbi:hypothetical protein R6Q57_002389 [Mikania cordata]